MHMTSPFLQFFENVNFSSSYKGLSAHQIWFNLGQGKAKLRRGGGGIRPPQVESVLNRPSEIGLSDNLPDFCCSFKFIILSKFESVQEALDNRGKTSCEKYESSSVPRVSRKEPKSVLFRSIHKTPTATK